MTEDLHYDTDWYDRKIRSFVTSMLLDDEDEAGEIMLELLQRRDDPNLTIGLASAYWAMVSYLLSHMAVAAGNENSSDARFTLWAYFMREIELESLQDGV